MKKIELEKIYERETRKKGRDKDPGEFAGWAKYLLRFDSRDVQEALVEWGAQSRFLPLAKEELLPLVEAAQRKREAAAREPQDLLIWRCRNGHPPCTGYLPRSQPDPERHCRVCREPMICERKAA